MRAITITARTSVHIAMSFAVLLFAGCATYSPGTNSTGSTPEVVVETTDSAVVPKPPQLPPVAIVLTSGQAAYADVATELAHHFDDFVVYDLSDKSRPPVSAFRSINDSESVVVLAIGSRAAQSSVAMSDVPVVFSQVFNYQDYNLVNDKSRGVAAIAPLAAQLKVWKKIDPTLTRIGLIIGEGHDDLIAEAEVAAAELDLELLVRISHSDQETLFFFRRMVRDIEGFWLFPDNRILSARVLKPMLDEANQQHVPVTVPNEVMLEMGAAISISTVASDIAETIVSIVRRIQAGEIDEVPPITRLSEIRIKTNDKVLTKQTVAETGGKP
jgi:ABC-type uncharacterized transport system substrate-binding protein